MDFGDTISTTHYPSGPGDKQVVMILFLQAVLLQIFQVRVIERITRELTGNQSTVLLCKLC